MLRRFLAGGRACSCLLVGFLVVFATGCRKARKPNSEVVPAAPIPAAPVAAPVPSGGSAPRTSTPAAPAGADEVARFLNSSEFADLTKAYQVFYYQKKRHTTDLQELVQARYLRAVPPPPPGKSYAIDQKALKVILVP